MQKESFARETEHRVADAATNSWTEKRGRRIAEKFLDRESRFFGGLLAGRRSGEARIEEIWVFGGDDNLGMLSGAWGLGARFYGDDVTMM